MKTNKAKFFCENCGSEVPENAKVCKVCGKFFISVRCPQCGAIGNHDDFADGCPKCGYAVGKSSKSAGASEGSSSISSGRFSGFRSSGKGVSNREDSSSLPVWIYIFTAVVLFGVLFAVYSCIK